MKIIAVSPCRLSGARRCGSASVCVCVKVGKKRAFCAFLVAYVIFYNVICSYNEEFCRLGFCNGSVVHWFLSVADDCLFSSLAHIFVWDGVCKKSPIIELVNNRCLMPQNQLLCSILHLCLLTMMCFSAYCRYFSLLTP